MPYNDEFIIIDGSYGEGGGQILRTSLALSAATGKPIKIVNIRSKRKNPGIQHQHFTAVRALATLSNAEVKGLKIGSTELVFKPRELVSGEFKFDVGTAGSVMLVAQAVLPVLPFIPGEAVLEISGGTDVPGAPTFDYFRGVVVPMLKMVGFDIEIEILRRGYYPRGGGLIRIKSKNSANKLSPVHMLNCGKVSEFNIVSIAHRLPKHVAERQASSSLNLLKKSFESSVFHVWYETDENSPNLASLDPGSSVAVIAKCENSIMGADSLGARGKPAEEVGREASQKLIEDLSTGAAVDRHLSDMLPPLLALVKGKSVFRGAKLTLHAVTNIEIVRKILEPRIILEREPQGSFRLEIESS